MRYAGWLCSAVLIVLLGAPPFQGNATAKELYGERYCDQEGFHCIKVVRNRKRSVKMEDGSVKKLGRYAVENLTTGEATYLDKSPSWESLWPDEREREIVRRLNRMNIRLRRNRVIAVPADMTGKTFMDYAPFSPAMETGGEKLIVFDPAEVAWGAYNEEGKLVKWGPGAGGKRYCPDTGRACRTVVGDDFKILSKAGPNRRSDRYPPPRGGAPMPYYMPFYTTNYGFHGSPTVPGQNASHGCVRMFNEDAKWMNREFAEVGTRVVVLPYEDQKKAALKKKQEEEQAAAEQEKGSSKEPQTALFKTDTDADSKKEVD